MLSFRKNMRDRNILLSKLKNGRPECFLYQFVINYQATWWNQKTVPLTTGVRRDQNREKWEKQILNKTTTARDSKF